MVLYYNIVNHNNNSHEHSENSTDSDPVIHTSPSTPSIISVPSIDSTIKDENLADKINNLISGGHPEFYYSLMGDNFNDLSLNDKLLVIHKTSILRHNVTNNYILMCLALLLIIVVKLHSK